MVKADDRSTVVYPVLGSNIDLWFMRVAGHGLGNCFYTYFHAVALAEKHGAAVVAPPWFSLKIGPLLRGQHSKRLYWRMFRPFAGEIHGVKKLLTLMGSYRKRVILKVGESTEPVVVKGALNFIVSGKFTFLGLHAHRSVIRERLLGTVNDPVPADHRWGKGSYIAVHIRLGDFAEVADQSLIDNAQPNLRIPMSWYMNLTRALRKRYSDTPIYIFSDGEEKMLTPILDLGAKLYRTGSDMTDLLAMSGASILVGSNSTYSRWAAFLGNMPSIWLKTLVDVEKPSAPETPILYVSLDCIEPVLWE
jgi:Glycosyl transferase family 11